MAPSQLSDVMVPDVMVPDVMVSDVRVPDARVFSSIKKEQKYPWLYHSVVHQAQGYLCKFCGHSSSSQEFFTTFSLQKG
jgi:hypothetical protein